jgi:3-phytase
MIYLKESKRFLIGIALCSCIGCTTNLPEIPVAVITEQTPHDTDDPAIWVNKNNPENSIVFGTDKDDANGGVYAFDLDGKIIKNKSITGISYPNNVDVAYNFKLNDSTTTDVIIFTEREKHQIRLFSVPDMNPLDGGGFPVFTNESQMDNRRPMGIASYTDKATQTTYAIVSRKIGPLENYLHQYKFEVDTLGNVSTTLSRAFGKFSGDKEIEAIAVDEELGFVYYSDEGHCIRKYYANPERGNEELACFGGEYFTDDIEGIAIVKRPNGDGYLVVSNQQDYSFNVFDRKSNAYVKTINLGTVETDGCAVTTEALGSKFPNGLFVSMTDSKEFYFHHLDSLDLD